MHEHNHFLRNILIYGSFATFIFICWLIFQPMLSSEMEKFGSHSQESETRAAYE